MESALAYGIPAALVFDKKPIPADPYERPVVCQAGDSTIKLCNYRISSENSFLNPPYPCQFWPTFDRRGSIVKKHRQWWHCNHTSMCFSSNHLRTLHSCWVRHSMQCCIVPALVDLKELDAAEICPKPLHVTNSRRSYCTEYIHDCSYDGLPAAIIYFHVTPICSGEFSVQDVSQRNVWGKP